MIHKNCYFVYHFLNLILNVSKVAGIGFDELLSWQDLVDKRTKALLDDISLSAEEQTIPQFDPSIDFDPR